VLLLLLLVRLLLLLLILVQVAGQAAPATLKAAFLDPVADSMASEVAMQLFAKTDVEFMQMFTGVCWAGGRGLWGRVFQGVGEGGVGTLTADGSTTMPQHSPQAHIHTTTKQQLPGCQE
jgi:hypothetical protein